MPTTYISFGSNLQDPEQQIQQALQYIQLNYQVVSISPWYRSKAIGPGSQADYINGVLSLNTELTPEVLLKQLQQIEQKHGRKRDIRWGPRTLDLDILLYDNQEINHKTLAIPHPRMQERNFVIYPLYDICPQLILPNGTALEHIYQQLHREGLEKLA